MEASESRSDVSWSKIRTNAVARFIEQVRPSEKERIARFQIAQTFVENFKKFLCGAQLLKTGTDNFNQSQLVTKQVIDGIFCRVGGSLAQNLSLNSSDIDVIILFPSFHPAQATYVHIFEFLQNYLTAFRNSEKVEFERELNCFVVKYRKHVLNVYVTLDILNGSSPYRSSLNFDIKRLNVEESFPDLTTAKKYAQLSRAFFVLKMSNLDVLDHDRKNNIDLTKSFIDCVITLLHNELPENVRFAILILKHWKNHYLVTKFPDPQIRREQKKKHVSSIALVFVAWWWVLTTKQNNPNTKQIVEGVLRFLVNLKDGGRCIQLGQDYYFYDPTRWPFNPSNPNFSVRDPFNPCNDLISPELDIDCVIELAKEALFTDKLTNLLLTSNTANENVEYIYQEWPNHSVSGSSIGEDPHVNSSSHDNPSLKPEVMHCKTKLHKYQLDIVEEFLQREGNIAIHLPHLASHGILSRRLMSLEIILRLFATHDSRATYPLVIYVVPTLSHIESISSLFYEEFPNLTCIAQTPRGSSLFSKLRASNPSELGSILFCTPQKLLNLQERKDWHKKVHKIAQFEILLVVMDECQFCRANHPYQSVAASFSKYRILGLTSSFSYETNPQKLPLDIMERCFDLNIQYIISRTTQELWDLDLHNIVQEAFQLSDCIYKDLSSPQGDNYRRQAGMDGFHVFLRSQSCNVLDPFVSATFFLLQHLEVLCREFHRQYESIILRTVSGELHLQHWGAEIIKIKESFSEQDDSENAYENSPFSALGLLYTALELIIDGITHEKPNNDLAFEAIRLGVQTLPQSLFADLVRGLVKEFEGKLKYLRLEELKEEMKQILNEGHFPCFILVNSVTTTKVVADYLRREIPNIRGVAVSYSPEDNLHHLDPLSKEQFTQNLADFDNADIDVLVSTTFVNQGLISISSIKFVIRFDPVQHLPSFIPTTGYIKQEQIRIQDLARQLSKKVHEVQRAEILEEKFLLGLRGRNVDKIIQIKNAQAGREMKRRDGKKLKEFDYITHLNELLQSEKLSDVTYSLGTEDRHFMCTCRAVCEGKTYSESGIASSKKSAKQKSASLMLDAITPELESMAARKEQNSQISYRSNHRKPQRQERFNPEPRHYPQNIIHNPYEVPILNQNIYPAPPQANPPWQIACTPSPIYTVATNEWIQVTPI